MTFDVAIPPEDAYTDISKIKKIEKMAYF